MFLDVSEVPKYIILTIFEKKSRLYGAKHQAGWQKISHFLEIGKICLGVASNEKGLKSFV